MTIVHRSFGARIVAFSPDGWKIAAPAIEAVRIWDATPLKH
jgi:hypothetical protein